MRLNDLFKIKREYSLTSNEFIVLQTIADYYYAKGSYNFAYSYMATYMDLSERSVIYAIKTLEEKGLIEVIRTPSRGKMKEKNSYKPILDRYAKFAQVTNTSKNNINIYTSNLSNSNIVDTSTPVPSAKFTKQEIDECVDKMFKVLYTKKNFSEVKHIHDVMKQDLQKRINQGIIDVEYARNVMNKIKEYMNSSKVEVPNV